ncbi:MAG TPA: phospholipid carrier-dependent glycosyltransferase, partial [Steroidobacteraceae bacterium]|nr:phospholipid carrier-dependent glycosyltransferase [Steroidobacteraceae bacterium]
MSTTAGGRSGTRVGGLRWWGWAALAVMWLVTIQVRPMLDPDEGRYAEIPREMVTTGNWITPRLDGLKYFEKPALQYWATAAIYSVVGLSNWSSRLWTVVLGFACLPMVYAWVARLYDRRAAVAAVVALAVSPYFGIIGHLDLLDAGFTFWMCATVFAFTLAQCAPPRSAQERNGMLLCWALAALAILSKGIVVFVLAGGTLLAYSILERDWRPWRRMHFALGVPLLLALAAPWFTLVSLRNPDFAPYFFIHEHFQRFLTKEAHRVEPWWYFLGLLFVGAFPWLLSLGRAALAAWRESGLASQFKPLKFLLLFSAVTLVFFSISDSKLATYILPMFPPLAVFTGVAVASRPGFLARSTWAAAGLALFVAGGLLAYSHHRNGMIPAQAVGWGIAAAVAALAAVAGSWRRAPEGTAVAPAADDAAAAAGAWRSLAVALLFVFAWQALLCEYTVIPPSRSAYALVQEVAPDVHPGTALYSVGQYRQTIPPYLGRKLILVSFTGELHFGEMREPGREQATPEQ